MAALPQIDFDTLFEQLTPAATAVTATRRLSRAVLQAYARHREAAGDRVWERPDVLPWDAWLGRCWDDARLLRDLPAPMDPLQTQLWWEDIVAADSGDELLRPQGAARQAMTAWEVLCQWRLPRQSIRRGGEAGERFLRWAERFEARCRSGGMIDAPRLAPASMEAAEAVFGGAGRTLVLIGFDRIKPAQQALLDRLATLGWEILHAAPRPRQGRVTRRAYADADAEVRGFCGWVRQELAARPEARIGLIVRDLADRRGSLERLLTEGLAPVLAAPWLQAQEPPWNISLGEPLAKAPLAADALTILELLRGEADLIAWGRLLHSPFLAGAEEERLLRSLLDVALRDTGELTLTTGDVLARGRRLEHSPRRFLHWLAEIPHPGALALRSPSQWAPVFADALQAAGWPGPRTPDSVEYQCIGAVNDLISRFSALDAARPRLDLDAALALLRRIAAQQVFQPAGNDAAPVQVMGVLEVPGMDFDALWVLGAHDGQWPAPLQPAPFIPVALQRAHGLPEADPATALALDRDLAGRLDSAAGRVVWSWPRQAGEETLRPSPLIDTVAEEVAGETAAALWPHAIRECAPALEEIDDRFGVAMAEGSRMPGGTSFFRHQAACPFQGYAMHRLGAGPLEIGRFGPDPRERGALVHRVLEHLWGELGSRRALAALDAVQRQRTVEQSVDHVLGDAGARRPSRLSGRVAELERERLVELMLGWLAVEEKREDFEVVGTEVGGDIERGGLHFGVRLDRVDRLSDGSEVILDYKTGTVAPSALYGDRPDDLQLAFYARHHGSPISAVAWAVVRLGESKFAGLARDGECLPGVHAAARQFREEGGDADAWDALQASWDDALDALVAEARGGAARVAPKPNACRRCPLPGLCRVGERPMAEGPDA